MDFINVWDINGEEYEIRDHDRGLPNGVATLNDSGKVPIEQLPSGLANGVASLDANGRIPYDQLPESAIELKGYWNASTNTPTLADGIGDAGDFYYVDVAGTQDLGSGEIVFNVGDRVLYDGTIWKNISSGDVKSVNGITPVDGNVTLPTDDEPTSNSNNYVKSGGVKKAITYASPIIGTAFTSKLLSPLYGSSWQQYSSNRPKLLVSVRRIYSLMDGVPTEQDVILTIYKNTTNAIDRLEIQLSKYPNVMGTAVYESANNVLTDCHLLDAFVVGSKLIVFTYHAVAETTSSLKVFIFDIPSDPHLITLSTSYTITGSSGQLMSRPKVFYTSYGSGYVIIAIGDKTACVPLSVLYAQTSTVSWANLVGTSGVGSIEDYIEQVSGNYAMSSSKVYYSFPNFTDITYNLSGTKYAIVNTHAYSIEFLGRLFVASGIGTTYGVFFYANDNSSNPWKIAHQVSSELALTDGLFAGNDIMIVPNATVNDGTPSKLVLYNNSTGTGIYANQIQMEASVRYRWFSYANGVWLAVARNTDTSPHTAWIERSTDGLHFATVAVISGEYNYYELKYIDSCWCLYGYTEIPISGATYPSYTKTLIAYSDYSTLSIQGNTFEYSAF